MTELSCKPILEELLRAGMEFRGDALDAYLKQHDDAPQWELSFFGNEEIEKKYWGVFTELQKKLVPKYIVSDKLYEALWKLFRGVVLEKSEFQSEEALERKLDSFLSEVVGALHTFRVIVKISHLDIGVKDFVVGKVKLYRINRKNIDIDLEKYRMLEIWLNDWDGKIVAEAEISAAEATGANLLGMDEVKSAINILRLGTRKEFIGRSSDSLFLWEIGNSFVIDKTNPGHFALIDNRETYPFKYDLSGTFEKILNEVGVWSQILNEKLPQDIQVRLERAAEWISLAITEQSNDHKLIHLCTALEVLLLPDHDKGRKGEPIALRQVLVGQNVFQEPSGILRLYEQRGVIIHGGHLNITSFREYIHMLDCCLSILAKIVRLAQKFPEVDTLKGLLGKVENRETLQGFIENCERGMFKGRNIDNIKKAAKELLKQYTE